MLPSHESGAAALPPQLHGPHMRAGHPEQALPAWQASQSSKVWPTSTVSRGSVHRRPEKTAHHPLSMLGCFAPPPVQALRCTLSNSRCKRCQRSSCPGPPSASLMRLCCIHLMIWSCCLKGANDCTSLRLSNTCSNHGQDATPTARWWPMPACTSR
jgi:hypothetical protein